MYINSTIGTSRYINLWWSLCTLYLHACQVRNKAVNSRPKYATQVQQRPDTTTKTQVFVVVLVQYKESGLCCCTCAVQRLRSLLLYLCSTKNRVFVVVLVQSLLLYLCSLCCCTCVAYLGRELTALFVNSARAFWASFCFRFVVQLSQTIILRNCHCGARVRAGGVDRTQSAWFIDERGRRHTQGTGLFPRVNAFWPSRAASWMTTYYVKTSHVN